MASFPEAMKWHTARFLGKGPGRNVNAYPLPAADGTAEWWTFEGQRTDSPMGKIDNLPQPAVKSRFSRSHHNRPGSLLASLERADELRSRRELIERSLCSLACENQVHCPGAYDYSAEHGNAFCGYHESYVSVPKAIYEAASQ